MLIYYDYLFFIEQIGLFALMASEAKSESGESENANVENDEVLEDFSFLGCFDLSF